MIDTEIEIYLVGQLTRLDAVQWTAPHCVEVSPTGVACNPRDASVKGGTICSPTDDQPPPRQEGEAVVLPWLRQWRDEAGVGGRAREQLYT